MTEADDLEEAREKEFSLLRPELGALDFVPHDEEQCDAKLHISNVTHDCTRPAGHSRQHYSFHGGVEPYEVIWPIVPQKA